MPRTSIPDPEPEALEDEIDLPREAEMVAAKLPVAEQPLPPAASQAISVKGRADADARPVTLAPRAVSGFRLPPSTLLHRSDESQIVREDDLRNAGPDSGGKMRRVRCPRPGGADQSRPRGHDFRIPARKPASSTAA